MSIIPQFFKKLKTQQQQKQVKVNEKSQRWKRKEEESFGGSEWEGLLDLKGQEWWQWEWKRREEWVRHDVGDTIQV